MFNDRWSIEYLAELMLKRGMRTLVTSPGSRNAPILEAFCKNRKFDCVNIVDERSAAFFALGMAQQMQTPVAIACTSGSAPLNYAPAIAEAYYQRIPLIVLTADRPVEYIDQGDGQTIRQNNVFANFIKKSFQLPQSIQSHDDLWYANRLVCEALNAVMYPVPGPVHINIPFSEPLYGKDFSGWPPPKDFTIVSTRKELAPDALNDLTQEWHSHRKKLIIAGQMPPNDNLQTLLQAFSQDETVVVLTESLSNLHGKHFIAWIDRCLAAMPNNNAPYVPDLLITIGGPVISKRIKSWLRKSPAKAHWHVDPDDHNLDTYQQLTRTILMEPLQFLQQMQPALQHTRGEYATLFKELSDKARIKHEAFLKESPYSDLKIFEQIVNHTPKDYHIQLANSTPVRYAQLMDFAQPLRTDSNRGVSGIDGCTSTAAGAAFASGKNTLLITGDLAFFYDSNGLWLKNIPKNLKIIVIHNGGGGIFRFLNGPDTTGLLEEHFESRHNTSAEFICRAYGAEYLFAKCEVSLRAALVDFFAHNHSAIVLEIESPAEISATTLRNYFSYLGE